MKKEVTLKDLTLCNHTDIDVSENLLSVAQTQVLY